VPTYPEAVVVAWLLQQEAELVFDGQPTTPDAEREDLRDSIGAQLRTYIPRPPERIVSVGYEGVARTEGVGNSAQSTIQVVTRLEVTPGVLATYRWRLIEVRPGTSQETSRWRILAVEPDI
jgi:hypothetical protein